MKWALSSDDPRTCLSVDLFPDFPFMDGYQQVLFSYFDIRNIAICWNDDCFSQKIALSVIAHDRVFFTTVKN